MTGSSGFLGRAVVANLARRGWRVRAIVRADCSVPGAAEVRVATHLGAEAVRLLEGCCAVVNCAGRAHIMHQEDPRDAEAAFMAVNRDLAVSLAEAACSVGARRFIQVSSVATIASRTQPGVIVGDSDFPKPTSPYGRAKLEADIALAEMASSEFGTISLRPPAIYGPGSPAWFGMLNRAARVGLPLPLGRIENRRSFVFVGNVADAVATALTRHITGAFIITEGPPVSTAHLYHRLAQFYGHSRRVWNFPPVLIASAARLMLGARAESLFGDAAFDGSAFASKAGWTPPFSMDEGLSMTVAGHDAEA